MRLAKQDGAPDLQLLRDKSLFAQRCRQAGLPAIPLLAEFAEGLPLEPNTALPREDLVSKPATGAFGQGVRLWQYDTATD